MDPKEELALHLAAFFGTTPDYWLNGQMDWDLRHAKGPAGKEIGRIKPVKRART